MTEPLQTEKHTSGEAASGFDDLWRSGLAMVQALAGERWTDYNAHDPGVTILEQLCYALTESVYKSGFAVCDYLCGPDGAIDYDRQALFRPEDILPCRPVTLDDYRAAIFDAVPEIDDIYLDPHPDDAPQGRYAIRIRMATQTDEGPPAGLADKVVEQVRAVYGGLRNLCEDVDVVQIITPALCRLTGRVEIDGHRDPADLLAEIYFCCARLIAPGIAVMSYDTALKADRSLERVFTGPLIRSGRIGSQALATHDRPVTLADILGVVRSVEGVRGIHELALLDTRGTPLDTLPPRRSADAMVLAVPDRGQEIGITLQKKTRAYPVSARDFKIKYDQMEYNRQAHRQARQDFSALYDPPSATHRPLKQYTSIQHHFPRIYGIDREGVRRSAGPERLAQARQLKGYLLLFDQVMADFNAQLQHVGRLFSVDGDLDRTYFCQPLDDRSVPDIADLQVVSGDALAHKLSEKLKHYDDYYDRRNRVLDYLLAIYGEAFTQKYLRHFHYEAPSCRPQQILIDNKIRLLMHLPAIGRDRGAALDYHRMAWQARQAGGFDLKVRILLGMSCLYNRSLTSALASYGLKLISDEQFRDMISSGLAIPDLESGDIRVVPTEQFFAVPPEPAGGQLSAGAVEKLQQSILLLQRQFVNSSFFRHGIDPGQYQIGPLAADGGVQVIFKPFAGNQWCHLAAFTDRNEAVQAVNNFCRLLLHLNVASEGLHVVEHILLRPLTTPGHAGLQLSDDFYSFKISVLMPAWTVHGNDPAFRRHAEDTVRINCPAHVAVDMHWIDYETMHAFEMIYGKWLTAKSETPGGSSALDALSARIIRQLLAFQNAGSAAPAAGD